MMVSERQPRTYAGQHELLLKDEVYRIVGCAIEVANALGGGLFEKLYENALVVELGLQHIPVNQQRHFDVLYKGVSVGAYVPDLIVFDKIVVETKTVKRITDVERGQLINYLKLTRLRVGLVLNFYQPRLEWERIVV